MKTIDLNILFSGKENAMKFSQSPQEKRFLTADDVAEILNISKSSAYRIIKKLNEELRTTGKITVAGKISSKYFYENVYL